MESTERVKAGGTIAWLAMVGRLNIRQRPEKLVQVYSDLHQHIQDTLNQVGIEIMSPHYIATRDGNETTIPKS